VRRKNKSKKDKKGVSGNPVAKPTNVTKSPSFPRFGGHQKGHSNMPMSPIGRVSNQAVRTQHKG